jgi:HD-like signal output (HDOD) protein
MIAPLVENDEVRARAKLTVGHIHAGLESQSMPVVSQVIRIIRDISGKAERMSVNDLVEFISGEPTTMGRIVTIAGSVGYNSNGIEISSLHHAVSLIGFDRVRTLAISILLLEGTQSAFATEVNRELAGSAFVSGLVAAELGRRLLPLDPELCFICGALRGYGRILAATYMPKEYAEAVQLSARQGPDEAFKTVFGLSPLELGRQLLAGMQLPKLILGSFVNLSPQIRRQAADRPTTALIAATELGLRVAELLQTPGLTSHSYEFRIELLSRDYDSAFFISRSASRELLHHIVAVLESFRSRAGSYVGSVALFRKLRYLASEHHIPAPAAAFDPAPPSVVPRVIHALAEKDPGYFEI